VDASAVSDVLMSELVGDAAAELHRQQTENIVDRHSAFIHDAPSVETLLHRLRVIEVAHQSVNQSISQSQQFATELDLP